MQNLAGDKIPKETLIILGRDLLPASVRTVLAVANKTDPAELASMADKMETSRPLEVAAVAGNNGGLSDEVAKLSYLVAALLKISNNNGKERT